jgi:hypothetical protein
VNHEEMAWSAGHNKLTFGIVDNIKPTTPRPESEEE